MRVNSENRLKEFARLSEYQTDTHEENIERISPNFSNSREPMH